MPYKKRVYKTSAGKADVRFLGIFYPGFTKIVQIGAVRLQCTHCSSGEISVGVIDLLRSLKSSSTKMREVLICKNLVFTPIRNHESCCRSISSIGYFVADPKHGRSSKAGFTPMHF